ncbi:NucA/NucB deoxyribonuclease domain-containing protein [Corynebacterium doosanense]
MPYIAENISTAIAAGHPSTLTRATSDDRDANRVAVCGPVAKRKLESLQPKPPGMSDPSCDEYPFASATQGGANAQTKWVPSPENNLQGNQMSTFLRTQQVQYGDSYRVKVS